MGERNRCKRGSPVALPRFLLAGLFKAEWDGCKKNLIFTFLFLALLSDSSPIPLSIWQFSEQHQRSPSSSQFQLKTEGQIPVHIKLHVSFNICNAKLLENLAGRLPFSPSDQVCCHCGPLRCCAMALNQMLINADGAPEV